VTLKIWKEDDPKASLMERKRALIVQAAREAFLTGGYADSSMDSIAKSAGVSIKTVYRHFENKDDLFIAVMQAACSVESKDKPRDWPTKVPRVGLPLAAIEYLRHALSAEQLAFAGLEDQRRPWGCECFRRPAAFGVVRVGPAWNGSNGRKSVTTACQDRSSADTHSDRVPKAIATFVEGHD
jgi:AcrR family transcriptional regulator